MEKIIKIIKYTNYRSSKRESAGHGITRYVAVTSEKKAPNGAITRTGHFINAREAKISFLPIIEDTMEIVGV